MKGNINNIAFYSGYIAKHALEDSGYWKHYIDNPAKTEAARKLFNISEAEWSRLPKATRLILLRNPSLYHYEAPADFKHLWRFTSGDSPVVPARVGAEQPSGYYPPEHPTYRYFGSKPSQEIKDFGGKLYMLKLDPKQERNIRMVNYGRGGEAELDLLNQRRGYSAKYWGDRPSAERVPLMETVLPEKEALKASYVAPGNAGRIVNPKTGELIYKDVNIKKVYPPAYKQALGLANQALEKGTASRQSLSSAGMFNPWRGPINITLEAVDAPAIPKKTGGISQLASKLRSLIGRVRL